MKIFVSYQQTWVDKNELQSNLTLIRNTLYKLGHDNFIYFLDTQFENQTAKEIMSKAKNEIERSDIIVAFINYTGRSEGMMQELGIAYALGKKILIIMNKQMEDEYFLTYWMSSNSVFFQNIQEVEKLLEYNLPTWK